MEKIRLRDGKNSDPGWKKFGSGMSTPDQQHCVKTWQKVFHLKKTIMHRVLTCKRQARQRNMRKGFPWPNCVGGGRRLKHAKIRQKLYTIYTREKRC
jgi:hypothetical protein